MERKCLECGKPLHGRSDKKFCNTACKNAHNAKQRRATKDAVAETDAFLHRNREILVMLAGKAHKIMLDRPTLTRAGFRWEFMTGIYFNKEGKMYRLVYDYAWMDFSDQQVLLVRKKS